MKAVVFVAIALAFTAPLVATAPAALAAPPNLPPGSSCDYFHYHHGDLSQGQLPGYHWHPCL